MVYVFFIGMLLFLFLLSQQITRHLSRLLLRITHSQSVTIYVLSFLFLPGVILHELSHLLVAGILFVPTGEVEFFPEIHGEHVKMGSVVIAQTDPFRRFLIGVAPLLGGLGTMVVAAAYMDGNVFSWQGIVLFYILFQIANTMFASEKDMEGAVGFGIAMVAVVTILVFLKIPVLSMLWGVLESAQVVGIASRLDEFLALALGVDTVGLLVFYVVGVLLLSKK